MSLCISLPHVEDMASRNIAEKKKIDPVDGTNSSMPVCEIKVVPSAKSYLPTDVDVGFSDITPIQTPVPERRLTNLPLADIEWENDSDNDTERASSDEENALPSYRPTMLTATNDNVSGSSQVVKSGKSRSNDSKGEPSTQCRGESKKDTFVSGEEVIRQPKNDVPLPVLEQITVNTEHVLQEMDDTELGYYLSSEPTVTLAVGDESSSSFIQEREQGQLQG